jgi:hypothetical protein
VEPGDIVIVPPINRLDRVSKTLGPKLSEAVGLIDNPLLTTGVLSSMLELIKSCAPGEIVVVPLVIRPLVESILSLPC